MKYLLQSSIPGYEFSICTDYLCTSLEDIANEEINSLHDFIVDALQQYNCQPKGRFLYLDIEEIIYSYARKYIEDREQDLYIDSISLTDNGEVCEKKHIFIKDLLLEMLAEDRTDCSVDARVGGYVEKSILEFQNKGVWHVGLISCNDSEIITEFDNTISYLGGNLYESSRSCYTPCLWFGLEGTSPEKPWYINQNTSPEELSFWFEDDEWYIIKALGDFSDGFLIWYGAECGYCAPDLDVIRDTCPIEFSREDTVESLLRKIKCFILS